MNVEAGRKHRSDQLDLSSQPQAWLPAVDACLGPAAGTTDRSAKRISIVPNARWWPPPVRAGPGWRVLCSGRERGGAMQIIEGNLRVAASDVANFLACQELTQLDRADQGHPGRMAVSMAI